MQNKQLENKRIIFSNMNRKLLKKAVEICRFFLYTKVKALLFRLLDIEC